MEPSQNIRISIVIPVLNDTPALGALLLKIAAFKDQPLEIIVVDSAGDPAAAECCKQHHCSVVNSDKGRGNQLHAGAQRATGDVLWFLHADAEPPAHGIEAIRRAIRAGAVGGYFCFAFTGQRVWYKALLEHLINIRSRFGVPYGDQGLFIRQSIYLQTGGFPDSALFEEVPLVRAARRSGRFVALKTVIGVSPRRWERDGWIRRTLGNRLLALGYMLGISPATLARYYGLIKHQEQPEC